MKNSNLLTHKEIKILKNCNSSKLKNLFTKKTINKIDKNYGMSPFLWVCSRGKSPMRIIKHFISLGCDIHQRVQYGIKSQMNAIHLVCESLNPKIKILEHLIALGVETKRKDSKHRTALHYVCKNGFLENHEKFAKALIETGVDINAPDYLGSTALLLCCQFLPTNVPLISLLLQSGANPNTCNSTNKQSPFNCICQKNIAPFSLLKMFLKFGSDVDSTTRNGWTPLMGVCTRNDLEIDFFLHFVKVAKTVSATNKQNTNSLHILSENPNSNLKLTLALINAGCDLFQKDSFGKQPLHYLCKSLMSILKKD
ncbi:ankyrin repeat [Anaeramoeba flamelloides]|uniref:Ankyrin repeat n=1 Tax=Anaeramoeba flamelloides TaxID=1746091 RepID=A0ABQ8XXN5_9EUKA|nr:ankyrin repeat [Anaeramoeba flamelloides]